MNAYAKMGQDVAVETASPHKLISMLYEGAILAIVKAKAYMQNGEVAAKGESISKAMSIINLGLLASLDTSVGGELAHNLQMLYEYMLRVLLDANIQNDSAKLDEVAVLLRDLKGAWDAIEGKTQAEAAAPVERASVSYARA
ncbi:flagellar protein FliS [Novimethylophilus kurashikiensis]|uniref:Flagellar secretion chaperone FliS n=2 Tax=Novimethylophilus kurashikiensis TaxID=1825523 RepID=A0A2R5F8K3_9PROT|nr:flagellar protein FliS [Novimethylophilus kurashikiensis]